MSVRLWLTHGPTVPAVPLLPPGPVHLPSAEHTALTFCVDIIPIAIDAIATTDTITTILMTLFIMAFLVLTLLKSFSLVI